MTLALLAAAAAMAGWVDAVTGGGGLIQVSALLVGLPHATPAQILATNKVASVCGTATAAVTYARRLGPGLTVARRTALPMAASALLGAAGGAACARLIPASAFRPIVLVLLIAVGAYTVARPDAGHVTALRLSGGSHTRAAAAAGAALGFYDGILGPGTGVLLVFVLVGLGHAFLEASAVAKITNLATNVGALLVFVPQGAPLWRAGLAMGAANLAGGYAGARIALARGSRFVRAAFLTVVCGLVLRLGWQVLAG